MSDDSNEVRVSQMWPAELKEAVRDLVGSRGLTSFTTDAVREKLARSSRPAPPSEEGVKAEGPSVEPASVTAEVEPEADAEPIQAPEPGEPVERGESVAVNASPTLGVAARFSSSSAGVTDLLDRAKKLGVKRASELPSIPTNFADDQIEPTPAEHPTLQEELAAAKERTRTEETPQPTPPPAPALAPVPAVIERDLNDIDVDF